MKIRRDLSANKVITLSVGTLLLLAIAFFAVYSFSGRQHSQRDGPVDHRDSVDLALSKADDDFLDGNLNAAVKAVDEASDQAHAGIKDRKRRAQLVACAISYCNYNRRDKAVAVLKDLTAYDDETGRQAREVMEGIQRDDPAWRPRPMPTAAARAQLKALKARLYNDPRWAKRFVGQYAPKP